jgi:drug/metabolite transporter (DMT)-like permease
MAVGVLLAVMTAVSNAVSNVLQRIANRDGPEERNMSPTLIWVLLHRKIWLAGLAAIVTSFVLQAGALSVSQLALVQPIIVLELPLTLIGASVVLHAPLHRQEWGAAILLTAGLVILIAFLSPHPGPQEATSSVAWIAGVGGCVAVMALLIVVSRTKAGAPRAALIGAATGVGFGLTAAFTKAAMHALSADGIVGLLTAWPTYAMASAGLSAMFLMQNALQAGPLIAAQPGITLLDPFVAILWGVFAFHEHINRGPLLLVATFGGALMILGAFILSRSPVLEKRSGQRPTRRASSATGAHSGERS